MALLSGSFATPSTNNNLTTEGVVDWAHWGLLSATTFDHKSSGATDISDVTLIGGAPSRLRYNNSAVLFTWTDGTPNASATNTPSGIYVQAALNRGFQFTVPASTTVKQLKIYCGVFNAGGTLNVSLSDASASDYTESTLYQSGSASNRVYTIDFQAASASQTLTVQWYIGTYIGGTSNVTLQAATLITSAPTEIPNKIISLNQAIQRSNNW